MSMKPTPEMFAAGDEISATRLELESAITAFDAQVHRGNRARIEVAAEAAREALESHLDALQASWTLIIRQTRGGL